MTWILNIETATHNCSVSLAKDGKTIACLETSDKGYSHAELLHVYIERIIAGAGLSFKDLNAVAVSKGPGSYTGLRIGVSAAKGLCYALNIPLLAVDTLKVLAAAANGTVKGGLIIPMIDARRMEVYSAIYSPQLELTREVRAEIITGESFSDYREDLYFVGDCADKCSPVLNAPNHHFITDIKFPSAAGMSELSYSKYKKSDTEDVAYFEPYYLKEFFIQKKAGL